MTHYLEIHSENPQLRLIHRAIEVIRGGGIIVYPTDSAYALACNLDDKQALDRIRQIRRLDENHNFTLVCKDLKQVSSFSKINNDAFRLIKSLTPDAFTFILEATKEVPRRLQNPKKKTIGICIPKNVIAQALLEEFGEPLMTTTLILPPDTEALSDPYDIRERLDDLVDLIIDAGEIEYQPTTIIDCTGSTCEIIRQGKGIAPSLG
ncbi:MAG: L-threonylcarbamoyladenylate synthase [Methylococcales bacterium]|jgi:tRNA threonylcarbamoyl adenosine modification protein (Sua5/YciO/YrdC/YwlC family)|nr:L-threonylcarbamoyladenylate synthase [Methylococcales bacterium]